MKFVMLICDDPSVWENLPETERKAAYDAIWAHVEKWERRGRYVDGGKELQLPATARTIRRERAGGVRVTDGPYTEIKELIGGFMIIEADTIEDAVETASEWPGIQYGAAVEVRPVVQR